MITEENLALMEWELKQLLFEYAITTKVSIYSEFHGYDIMQQKKDWHGIPVGIASSIYLKALGIINRHADALYIETIDRVAQAKRYRYLHDHRTIAIGYILERANEYAYRKNEKVVAYLDDHYTAPEGRKEFVQYKATGTFGYKSSRLAHIEELYFEDSRSKMGLQASDLCCYIYQRVLCVENPSPRVKKMQDKMWHALEDIRVNGRQRIWP